MDQLKGFIVFGKEKKVYWLVKSLSGLKQAPKQWYVKLDQTILEKVKINECDKCVYIKKAPNQIATVRLYVDDMLIMSEDIFVINST